MTSLRNLMNRLDPSCCTHPDKYDAVVSVATLNLLSFAYFSIANPMSWVTSLPCLAIEFPRCLPNATASSRAEHPPWPKSGVIGCIASPATVTLDRNRFPNRMSQGYRNISGAHVKLERSECLTTSRNTGGKSFAKFSITSLCIISGSAPFSIPLGGHLAPKNQYTSLSLRAIKAALLPTSTNC